MKILIVDDHTLFAEGLKYLLESTGQEVMIHHVVDGATAIKEITDNGHPDLILLDINLPDISGYKLLERFQKQNIWSPVLMISATDTPSASGVALAKGAAGFVSKSSDKEALLLAIKTVLGGEVYMQSSNNTANLDSKISITNRQQQVLYLLSQGMLNKQIANELCISSNTVKAHLHDIFRLFNVSNRTAAVQEAYKEGLL